MTTIGRRRYSGAFPKTCQSDFGLTGFLSFSVEIPFAVLAMRSLTQYTNDVGRGDWRLSTRSAPYKIHLWREL